LIVTGSGRAVSLLTVWAVALLNSAQADATSMVGMDLIGRTSQDDSGRRTSIECSEKSCTISNNHHDNGCLLDLSDLFEGKIAPPDIGMFSFRVNTDEAEDVGRFSVDIGVLCPQSAYEDRDSRGIRCYARQRVEACKSSGQAEWFVEYSRYIVQDKRSGESP
jgi:hypothetical protein